MNIKQLEAFTLVVELGSFTRAAKLMFMTQPAISFQIKALEEQLGLQLLERAERRVFLTEAGKLVYVEAKKILASNRSILEYLAQLRGLNKGTLNLGASTIPGEYLLPQFLGEFKRMHPEIKLKLEIGSTQRITELVLAREVDLAVVGAAKLHPYLEYQPLFTDEVVVIVGTNHPLAEQKSITIAQLTAQQLIFREKGSGTRIVLEERLGQAGFAPEELNIVLELGSTRAIITAVQGNLGVGMVSGLAVNEALELGTVHQLKVTGLDLHRPYLWSATNPARLLLYKLLFVLFLEKKAENKLRI
jgi:DNA-binding transcriptional LysR family regulator